MGFVWAFDIDIIFVLDFDFDIISNPEFLDAITARARLFGKRIGVKYGEGFVTKKAIGINSLDALVLNET